MRKISIIIVNYNSGDFLNRCLKSIHSHVNCDYEVIIVDNASSDTSFSTCEKKYGNNSDFKFIQAGDNLGFAKANNLGVEYSEGNILHFLNPDTELPNDISFDYKYILDNSTIVGINRLRNLDGTIVKSDHLIPTLKNYIKALFGNGDKWHIGASVIISRDNFYKIGKWNENYFMYYEDLDLFYQLSKNGIKCKVLQSIIMHIGGGCSSNVWSNKERLNRVIEAQKKFYNINYLAWEYSLIKFICKFKISLENSFNKFILIIRKLMVRFGQIQEIIKGYIFKLKVDLLGPPKLFKLNNGVESPQLIVSLTSYGRRVANNVVYYTLISLLRQTFPPNRIILWLDKNNWNDNNIPVKLKKLQKYGVEIRFCKDIRSYTKLVPTLTLCPKDTIITVDDDIIYRKDLISDLYNCHIEKSTDIICNMARFPKLDADGNIEPYEKWFTEEETANFVMPLGVSGVLYPPNSLFRDTTNEDLFRKLSPIADDIWFWIMGILNGAKYQVINQHRYPGCSFDALYQYFHRNSSLTHQNREEGENDKQLKNILNYYNVDMNNLLNDTFTSDNF